MAKSQSKISTRTRRVLKAPSPAEIEAAKTPNGGWTRATLASWGVPWPPPPGWKRRLEDRYERLTGDYAAEPSSSCPS